MTTFQRIKSAVEQKKREKIRTETQIENLKEEHARLTAQVREVVGRDIESTEELTEIVEEMERSIASQIEGVGAMLRDEGVEF